VLGLFRLLLGALRAGFRSRQAPGYIVPIELARAGKSGVPPSELGPRLRVVQ